MIPYFDPHRGMQPIRRDILKAMEDVYDSGVFVSGDRVEEFEGRWAAYCHTDYAIATASGTDSLIIAGGQQFRNKRWESRRRQANSNVWVQANTTPFTVTGLIRGGAKIRFCDCDDMGHMEKGRGYSAVPVLLYGRHLRWGQYAVGMVDACQAHGWIPPSKVIACWSFYPTKNLGCIGDGGAITTNSERVARKSRAWRDTIHSRMSEMQAAVLTVKLELLDSWNAQRRALADVYYNELPDSMTPVCPPDEIDLSNHHMFAILVDWKDDRKAVLARELTTEMRVIQRDSLKDYLTEHDIGCKVNYPDAFKIEHRRIESNADRWCASVLCLPMYPGLTSEEVREVCDTIRTWDNRSW